MPPSLRAVGLDFVTSAPVIKTATAHVPAPRADVWAALTADPSTWTQWFPKMTGGSYPDPGPQGVGKRRSAELSGGREFHETILAWDEPTRFAYRLNETTMGQQFRALIEHYELADEGTGTRVRFTLAVDPTPLGAPGIKLLGGPMVRAIHRKAMKGLARHLAGS